jgi:hypothetical protein
VYVEVACVLRYDNERGEGDHRHAQGREVPYVFTTPASLIADFWADVAKLVGRDIKGVRGDVRALLRAGILDEAADGKVVFPYDSLRVDFSLRADAACRRERQPTW